METELTLSEQPQVDRRAHWAVRLLYFFFFGGMGVFFSYINVYYLSIGLSGVQIGVLGTINPLVGVFSSILWGMASDRFGRPRLLFALTAAGALGAVSVLGGVRIFAILVPVVIWMSLFSSPMPALMDSTTFRLLGNRPERFGRYRMFGTMGFILTSATSGFLFEKVGLQALFPAYGLTLVFFLLTSFALPNTPIHLRTSPLDGLGQLVRHPSWALFAGSILVLWVAASGAVSFIGVAIKDLGGSDRLIGLNWTVAASLELPMMWFSAALLRRFGAKTLITVGFLGYFVRIIGLGIIPAAEYVLLVNAVHVFSYVPILIGAAAYANELAPAELKATSQGLLFAVYSMGAVFGSLLSGWLYDQLGVQGMFRTMAMLALAGFFLFVLGRLALHHRRQSAS
jgi:MFS transporter, PPP family, 3-phenylpropionic acid transporter